MLLLQTHVRDTPPPILMSHVRAAQISLEYFCFPFMYETGLFFNRYIKEHCSPVQLPHTPIFMFIQGEIKATLKLKLEQTTSELTKCVLC